MDAVDDIDRRDRPRHCRFDDDEPGLQGGGRKSAGRGARSQGRQVRRRRRARWSRWTPDGAVGPWSAAAITPRANSIAPFRPSASRARPSSLSSISPRSNKGLTPDTMREDAPIEVRGWRPENYEHEYLGPVTLDPGARQSLNTVVGAAGARSRPRSGRRAPRYRLGITSMLAAQSLRSRSAHREVSARSNSSTAYAPFANGGIGVLAACRSNACATSATARSLYQRKGADARPGRSTRYIGDDERDAAGDPC